MPGLKLSSLKKLSIGLALPALIAVLILTSLGGLGAGPGAANAAYNSPPGPEFTTIAGAVQSYLSGLNAYLYFSSDTSPATISADDLFKLLDTDHDGKLGSQGDDYRKGPTIIDVRSATDYSNGHIPGAINIPYQNVTQPGNLTAINNEIAKHNNDLVVVQCYTGHTEQISAMALGSLGYKVKGLKWGMLSWNGTSGAPTYSNSNAVSTTTTQPTLNNPYPTIAPGTTVAQAANAAATETPGGGYSPSSGEDPSTKTYVDVRDPSDYNAGHVPGAINIPWQTMFAKDSSSGAYPYLEELPRGKQIIVYGNTHHESQLVAVGLNMLGYESTSSSPAWTAGIRFGLPSWNAAYGEKYDASKDSHSYPLVKGSAPGGYLPGPLTVTKTDPAAGATGVPANTKVSAVFSKAVDETTVTSSNFYLADPAGDKVLAGVSYDGQTNTATLNPLIGLTMGTTYTATITTGVKDTGGNPMATAFSWSFTVAPCNGMALPGGYCLPLPRQ